MRQLREEIVFLVWAQWEEVGGGVTEGRKEMFGPAHPRPMKC